MMKRLLLMTITPAALIASARPDAAPDHRLARSVSLSAPVAATFQDVPPASTTQTRTRPPLRMTAPVRSTTFKLQDNLIRIPVKVNGETLSGVLDSGTGTIGIDRKVIEALGLRERETGDKAAGGGSEGMPLFSVTIDALSAGPLRFAALQVHSMDLSHLSSSARFPVDVLIGAPAFMDGVVSIDYPNQRVTFGPTGSGPKCAAPIPLRIVHNVPVVRINVRSAIDAPPAMIDVMVDLGTRHAAVLLGGPFLRSEAGKALLAAGVESQVGHGIGGTVRGKVARAANLHVGAMAFNNLEVRLTPDVPAFEMGFIEGTLGVPLWMNGVISFDYPAGQLCITLPGKSRDADGESRSH